MTDLPDKALLRPDEVAKYFSVSVKTVYRWIDMGRIEGVKIAGGLVRIPREAIDKTTQPAVQ
jgi:excisionase family DNA binding protein